MATQLRPRSVTYLKADIIETLGYRTLQIADDFRTQARTTVESERRINEIEHIAAELRAQVRGATR